MNERKDAIYGRLWALMDSGVIRIEGSEYVGRAADGTDVNLGHVTQTLRLCAYLSQHPTPEDW